MTSKVIPNSKKENCSNSRSLIPEGRTAMRFGGLGYNGNLWTVKLTMANFMLPSKNL